jgi:hypothetical protein
MSSLISNRVENLEKSFRRCNAIMISKQFCVAMRKSLDLSEVGACLKKIFLSEGRERAKQNSPGRWRAGTLVTNYFFVMRPLCQRQMMDAKKINAGSRA